VAAAVAAGYMIQDDKSFDLPWQRKKQRSFFLLKPPSVTKPFPSLLDPPCNVEQESNPAFFEFLEAAQVVEKRTTNMWNKKGLQLSLPPGDDDEALV